MLAIAKLHLHTRKPRQPCRSVWTLIDRLRKECATLVREEIERTVPDSGDIDAEIHDLCEALVAAEGWIVP